MIGAQGTYTIDWVYDTTYGTAGEVQIYSYYDADTGGIGWNNSVSGSGKTGLGSESGTITNYDGMTTGFTTGTEADFTAGESAALQLYYYHFTYNSTSPNSGDTYYGYGYTNKSVLTYTSGQTLASVIGAKGTYTIDWVYDTTYGTAGEVQIYSYYDADTGGIGWNNSVSGSGKTGLGSESGTITNYDGMTTGFTTGTEADFTAGESAALQLYYYHFTYNSTSPNSGDTYYGYGYTNKSVLTYTSGQTLASVIGAQGTYTIDWVYDTTYGTAGEVQIYSYYDADTGGIGWNNSVSGSGNTGLGSESGTITNYDGMTTGFTTGTEADFTAGESAALQLYYYHFTYNSTSPNSGDTYYGYGYTNKSVLTYTSGQTLASVIGAQGTYTIDWVYDTTYGTAGEVQIYSYYDADTGGIGWNNSVSGSGNTGLGSESGTITNYDGMTTGFTTGTEADFTAGESAALQLYYYHFTYNSTSPNSGDTYYGYGYTNKSVLTYTSGQTLASVIGAQGTYTIDWVYDTTYGTAGEVQIYSYYDADTGGIGWNNSVSGSGKTGLGSESGTITNYDGMTTGFTTGTEADFTAGESAALQLYYYHFTYNSTSPNSGDTYYGYGYTNKSVLTYTSGQTLASVIGAQGTYTIDWVYDTTYGTAGEVQIYSYYDADTGGIGWNNSVSGSGNTGLGSESGTITNYDGMTTGFTTGTEADFTAGESAALQLYYYHFTYNSTSPNSGDTYYGYGYTNKSVLTYTSGQTLASVIGAQGTYTIDWVYDTTYGTAGEVQIYSYYDADTGGIGWNNSVSGSGKTGLGSESGTITNYDGMTTGFTTGTEADFTAGESAALQLYYYHFTYNSTSPNSGDTYYGYGYTNKSVLTYTSGQTLASVIGAQGTYTIDWVYDTTYGTAGEVQIYSYYDADTGGIGWNNSVSGSGKTGLGSEEGKVTSSTGLTNSFTISTEADFTTTSATLQIYYFHFTYTSGDTYYGYGTTLKSDVTYAVGNITSAQAAAISGEAGTYTIDYVYDTTSGTAGEVQVYSYYDADTGGIGWNNMASGSGNTGLGSESGTVTSYDGLNTSFSTSTEADFSSANLLQYYQFHFTYDSTSPNSGDTYYGYGYAAANTYTVGTVNGNSIVGEAGTYTIDYVYDSNKGTKGEVTVYSYYDSDGVYWDNTVSASGLTGLGSESGSITNLAGSTTTFTTASEADFVISNDALQYYQFHFTYTSGDTYYGYGYTNKSVLTYAVGNLTTAQAGAIVGEEGTYTIDWVYDTTYGTAGRVYVSHYYDADTGGAGYNNEVHLEKTITHVARTGTTVTITTSGNHGYAVGDYVYVADTSYSSLNGYFEITAVTTTTFNYTSSASGTIGTISTPGVIEPVASSGTCNNWVAGISGLGSESGSVVNYNNESRVFSPRTEADFTSSVSTLQYYSFRFTYAGGDYYDGYGFVNKADVANASGTPGSGYSTNQTIIAPTGTYVIGYVQDANRTWGSANEVHVYSYYDADGVGWNVGILAAGSSSGLGTEAGWVFDWSDTSKQAIFTSAGDADLSIASANSSSPAVGFTTNETFTIARTAITNVAVTSNVATITTSTAHGYTTGDSVTVDSSSDDTLDGTYTITGAPTTTTFTYARTAINSSSADTGTVANPKVTGGTGLDTLIFSGLTDGTQNINLANVTGIEKIDLGSSNSTTYNLNINFDDVFNSDAKGIVISGLASDDTVDLITSSRSSGGAVTWQKTDDYTYDYATGNYFDTWVGIDNSSLTQNVTLLLQQNITVTQVAA
ncbi:sericin 1 [Methylophilaceae bacterium]|nr:sericin 1 [Methylophilaceae bacterium]